jgi:hypothetical protein
MIEPTDDDEHTTSLGLFNTAEAYRVSAMALPDIKHGHPKSHGQGEAAEYFRLGGSQAETV